MEKLQRFFDSEQINMISNEKYHLRDIEDITIELSKKIEGDVFWLPTFGDSIGDAVQDATPLVIEVWPRQFSYLIIEKGNIWEEKTTSDPDQILFWIFKDITYSIANHHSAKISNVNIDSREILFNKQIELLEEIRMNKHFVEELKREYNVLLGKRLFADV